MDQLRACYEAGPTGYVLYWQLAELGVECAVIAPTLVPVKAGDRVKTDRRDAERRAREAAKQDQLRARHRLSKFLLRTGQRPAPGVKAWTQSYLTWVRQIRFTQVAQESTRLDYLTEVEHMGERGVRLCVAQVSNVLKQLGVRLKKSRSTPRSATPKPTVRDGKSLSSAFAPSRRNA